MRPQSPVLPGYETIPEIKFAENQPQYQTLPAIKTPEGLVLSRWEPTEEERAAFATGKASLFICVWLTSCERCGNDQPLTPILPELTTAREIIERAANLRVLAASAPANGHSKAAVPAQPDLLNNQVSATEEALPPAIDEEDPPPTDDEIKILFQKIWTSQLGTPGYKERRWRELRTLLGRRGIVV